MKLLPGLFIALLSIALSHQVFCQNLECMQIIAQEDLSLNSVDQLTSNLDAGEGVIFRLIHSSQRKKLNGPLYSWMRIAVLDRGMPVKELPDSYYIGYGLLSAGQARIWMIGEYTGGMHCCARYHFLAKPTEDKPLRYVGATLGSSAGIEEEPFLCRNGTIYLKDYDTRFLYFHTPYSQSRLEIPIYYRLTPYSLFTDNKPFAKQYHEEMVHLDYEIKELLIKRKAKPLSLLQGNGGSPFFSDEIGQLLIKQALLLLYAGDDKSAWNALDRGVKQHYGSTKGLGQIKLEIKKILKESP
jgi:hypothetical protein